MSLGLKKPSVIPKLEEVVTDNLITELKESISEFDMKVIDDSIIQYLSQTEPYFPVISVKDKCYILAVSSKQATALVWLCGWFEIESAYRDRNNVYRVSVK